MYCSPAIKAAGASVLRWEFPRPVCSIPVSECMHVGGRGLGMTCLDGVGFGVEDVGVRAVVVGLPDVVWGVDEVAIAK